MSVENEAKTVPRAAMSPPSTATGLQPSLSHKDVDIGPVRNMTPYVILPTHAVKEKDRRLSNKTSLTGRRKLTLMTFPQEIV